MCKGKNGFTLIELLVVIIIIAALVVVLIVVIDPSSKNMRARDATVTSTMNKAILSTEGFISSYAFVPDEYQFFMSLQTSTEQLRTSCEVFGSPDYECLFRLQSVLMPSTCATENNWRGGQDDTGECYMRYYAGYPGRDRFRLYAKSFGIIDNVFVYDSMYGGEIYRCHFRIEDNDDLSSCSVF